jgi:rubrerythrin
VEHRAPEDELRQPYDKKKAALITKLHATTIMAAEHQTHDYYMTVGPTYPDPIGRQLYAEIASIEEQHITQYESIIDPDETWLEKWLMHEACEVYNYYACVQQEKNPRIKAIWERFLDYELGHLAFVRDIFESVERRDASEILPDELPEPIKFESQREFVRKVLTEEVDLRADGPDFVMRADEPRSSLEYRRQMNSEGSPSQIVAAGYRWAPGTELHLKVVNQ